LAEKGLLVMKIKNGIQYLNTWDLIKMKLKKPKLVKQSASENIVPPPPYGVDINNIAIILDDEVQEVIRTESRLAALLLSSPSFVQFFPEKNEFVTIGTQYINEEFVFEKNEEHDHENDLDV
jgi:hypothetical protein